MLRTDILPDLDYEAGEASQEICGIYMNSLGTTYTANHYKAAIGSFVLGDESNPDFGKFIGVVNGFWPSPGRTASTYYPIWPSYLEFPSNTRNNSKYN